MNEPRAIDDGNREIRDLGPGQECLGCHDRSGSGLESHWLIEEHEVVPRPQLATVWRYLAPFRRRCTALSSPNADPQPTLAFAAAGFEEGDIHGLSLVHDLEVVPCQAVDRDPFVVSDCDRYLHE